MTLYINTKDSKMVTVALKKGSKIHKSLSEENERGSQVLLLLIVRLLQQPIPDCQSYQSGIGSWKELKGIEVETGPGSFTGLRVGASVAQALGFALNIPVNGQIGKPIQLRYT